jgi:prepilin-type N-terminal cleavage/methylation domain-containing protein
VAARGGSGRLKRPGRPRGWTSDVTWLRSAIGYTLPELLLALGLVAVLSGIAIPQILGSLEDFRTYGAARYMSGRLHQTRMAAVVRSANAAIRFTHAGESYAFAAYLDGNRNGVRGLDIQRGIDREIQRQERLSDLFPGVDFGAVPGLPSVEPGGPAPGEDPVRFGSSNMAAFGALGTSTPGSLYIKGRRDAQYVVRLFGQTGKIRVLKFNPRTREWKPI